MNDINIVYVNYRMKDDIVQSIRTVLDDVKDSEYKVAITVVDNSENNDGIHEALTASFPQVMYVDVGKNIGFGHANNIGMAKQPARYYFALNRDTLIPENSGTIVKLIQFMDNHPTIGCIGPKMLNLDGSLQYSCYRFDLNAILIKPFKQIHWDRKYDWVRKHTDHLLMQDFDHNTTRPVDWVLGAAMVVRHEVCEDTGIFDQRYFMYLEDCDWCHRMWLAGWPVYYVPNITIKHRHARESAKVPGILNALFKNKLARTHLWSWMKYLWKWKHDHKSYANIS